MSTHSRPIVFVGQRFETDFEALEFIKDHNLISEEETKTIKEKINSNYCGLEDCLADKFKNFPSNQKLNYVTGKGYFIGYTIAAYKTKTDMLGFLEDIEIAQEKWRAIFNEDGVVCIDIQTS